MTYRERREARAERLRDWAEKRDAKGNAAYESVRRIADGIPLGQPILVGHHSEKRHRRDAERIQNGMRSSIEHSRTADAMRSRADEIERQADHAIYNDDPDAIERLRERIAALETQRADRTAANAAYRKAHRAELAAMTPYQRSQAVPWPSYSISNIGGNISRLRARLDALDHPRPTWFHASRRDPETCYKCDHRRADHTPHPKAPTVLMCPAPQAVA